MRQIKFRGKRVDGKGWVYGSLNTWQDGTYEISHSEQNDEMIKSKVDPATVGQFTGLLDKNGNEIWEGDVYRIEFSKIEELYSVDINVIKYSIADGYSGFTIEFSDFAEVIGNIHDNPSLLTNK